MFNKMVTPTGSSGGNIFHKIGNIDSSGTGTATVTCNFTPKFVVCKVKNGNDWCMAYCDNSGGNNYSGSIGWSNSTYYTFSSPYGITISGNTITINTGFAFSVGKEYELLAI